MQNKARKVQSYFIQRERVSGERFYCLRNDTPKAIYDLVMEAHGTDMFPDDFRYEAIVFALGHFAAGGTLDDYHFSCDVHTSALLGYLGSGGDRLGRADEVISEGIATDIASAAMVAQQEEAREVAYRLAGALNDLEEEEEEDDITDEQIERFEREAGEAGDLEAVATCRRAIAGDDSARTEVAEWIADGEAMRDVDELVDADGDCRECGHPADGSSGWGGCDSAAHRG